MQSLQWEGKFSWDWRLGPSECRPDTCITKLLVCWHLKGPGLDCQFAWIPGCSVGVHSSQRKKKHTSNISISHVMRQCHCTIARNKLSRWKSSNHISWVGWWWQYVHVHVSWEGYQDVFLPWIPPPPPCRWGLSWTEVRQTPLLSGASDVAAVAHNKYTNSRYFHVPPFTNSYSPVSLWLIAYMNTTLCKSFLE